VTTQTGAVAAGPLDRPGPQRRVVVGELDELGIALGCRLDGDLVEDTTGRGVEDRRGVGMYVGVYADDDIDHFAQIGQTAKLGSSIPRPAFHKCMTAIILVRVGSHYGVSNAAQPRVIQMLKEVTVDRWECFFDGCLPVDSVLLAELVDSSIAKRWCDMLDELHRTAEVIPSDGRVRRLLEASRNGQVPLVTKHAHAVLDAMR
jgi:hypothetical protein